MKPMMIFLFLMLSFTSVLLGQPHLKAGDRIVTLGDSITEAGGYQAVMKNVLDRFYPDLKIQIINAGISGHKSPDMAARLRRDVIDKNPTIVTISCGVNDVWHGFSQPPRGVDLNSYTRFMTQMVQELKKLGSTLILWPDEDIAKIKEAKLPFLTEIAQKDARNEKNVQIIHTYLQEKRYLK